MEKRLLELFEEYLSGYVKHMFSIDLSSTNLDAILTFQGNERQEYVKYFLWALPEYREWYIENGYEDYMFIGKNAVELMGSLFFYNSYFLDSFHNLMKIDYNTDELKIAKEKLGSNSYNLLVGLQKFIWTFISALERSKEELNVSSS